MAILAASSARSTSPRLTSAARRVCSSRVKSSRPSAASSQRTRLPVGMWARRLRSQAGSGHLIEGVLALQQPFHRTTSGALEDDEAGQRQGFRGKRDFIRAPQAIENG